MKRIECSHVRAIEGEQEGLGFGGMKGLHGGGRRGHQREAKLLAHRLQSTCAARGATELGHRAKAKGEVSELSARPHLSDGQRTRVSDVDQYRKQKPVHVCQSVALTHQHAQEGQKHHPTSSQRVGWPGVVHGPRSQSVHQPADAVLGAACGGVVRAEGAVVQVMRPAWQDDGDAVVVVWLHVQGRTGSPPAPCLLVTCEQRPALCEDVDDKHHVASVASVRWWCTAGGCEHNMNTEVLHRPPVDYIQDALRRAVNHSTGGGRRL
jgi:hypothetical protein